MIVRTAEPAEYATIGALTVAAYWADGQLDGDHGYESTLADVGARAESGEVLVAIDGDGAVLGGVTLVRPGSPYAELSAEGEFEFRMLAVDPAAKGRGVGEALVRACIERAVAAEAEAVVIFVRDFAVRAQRLYERLGFQRTPELDWAPYPGVTLLALRLPLEQLIR
jgi:ribosomal protein S18 acetylase RimI-like enzyme